MAPQPSQVLTLDPTEHAVSGGGARPAQGGLAGSVYAGAPRRADAGAATSAAARDLSLGGEVLHVPFQGAGYTLSPSGAGARHGAGGGIAGIDGVGTRQAAATGAGAGAEAEIRREQRARMLAAAERRMR